MVLHCSPWTLSLPESSCSVQHGVAMRRGSAESEGAQVASLNFGGYRYLGIYCDGYPQIFITYVGSIMQRTLQQFHGISFKQCSFQWLFSIESSPAQHTKSSILNLRPANKLRNHTNSTSPDHYPNRILLVAHCVDDPFVDYYCHETNLGIRFHMDHRTSVPA